MVFWRRSNESTRIEVRIREALAELRPSLPGHAVGVHLIGFERDSGVARVSLRGDCAECDVPLSHLRSAIEVRLRMRVPEIRSVILEDEVPHG